MCFVGVIMDFIVFYRLRVVFCMFDDNGIDVVIVNEYVMGM